MEVTPDKFLWLFLVVATLGWILFNFTAKLLAWIASTVLRAKVQFRLAGFQRLKDVTINFQKGAVAHLAIGEVRFSVRKQLKAFFGDYKFQLFLSDVEVVLQKPPTTTSKKAKAKLKVSTHRNSASERRKWLIVATLAKYLKFSITELVFKVLEIPNMSLEIKELDLDLLKEDVGSSLLGLKLSVIPCTIYLGELENWVYNSGITKFGQRLLSVTRASSAPVIDTAPSVLFLMEHLSVACSFDHDREAGVMMQQLEVACGDAMLDLNEELLVSENDPLGASIKPVKNIETAEKQKDEVTVVPMVNPPSSSLEKEEDGVAVDVPPGRVVKVPEKLGFTLPSLTVKCTQEGGQMMENKVKGILLRGGRSRLSEQAGDLISQLDIHMDCGEILIMCENKQSVLEILKVAVAASLEFPAETRRPLQAQIDVKLGGTQCNLLTASLDCWLKFALRVMKKNSNLRHEHQPATETGSPSMPTPPKRTKSSTKRKISWGCTLSAPDMLLTAYSLDGMALYNVSSQTSHLFINTGSGKEMALHAELGECVISMAEEADSSSEDPLAGGESIAGCLMRVSRVVVEWGLADSDLVDVTLSEKKSKTLVAEFSGSKLYFSFPRLQSILSTAMVMEKYLKTLSNERKSKKTNSMRLTQKKAGGIKQAILRLEGFTVQLMGLLHAEDEKVPDPKKVNFGNQGGESVVTKSSDGSLRTAMIHVTKGNRFRSKYNAIAELAHLNLCFDKEVHGFTVEVERGSLLYQELSPRDKVLGDITAFRVQNLEVIYQPAVVGGENGNLALVSATGVMTRWEPDLHLFCHEVGLQTKGLLDFRKSLLRKERNSPLIAAAMKVVETKETIEQNSRKVTVALDVEGFDFIAEVADGVELVLHVGSLFSEDAEIGLLLEKSLLTLNSATVLSSESLQISRIPVADEQHKEGPLRLVAGLGDFKRWDCIIQGSGTRIIMPYRMPFRAMEDACEDMWRTLKLVMVAQKSRSGTKAAAPTAAVVTKARTKRSSEMRALKFVMQDVVAEIEEEPLQGWFDEHHRLMAEEVCELIFREQLFNDKVAKECCRSRTHVSNSDGEAAAGSQSGSSQKQQTETGLQNPSTVKKEHERLQRQTFNAYHGACKKLVPYMGSGAEACGGLQAGFKPSITRRSLASITAASLEVVLTKVEGGREGMIEIIRKLDCVSPDLQVPFSRVMGRKLQVQGSSLAVCLRDYSAPMLAAESGSCDGVVVLAQQATVFPPQIPQDVYLGRWRRITVNRSISGSTPPLKCYLQIPVELDTAKVSYGVGHEPAIADVSYAFSIALRKMDISVRRDQWPEKIPLPPLPIKKERNLPWWDDMRYYIHGNNSVNVTNFEWSFLATTNPYEEANMMRLVSNSMEIKQSEGCVVFNGKEFGLHISSLEIVPKGLDSGVYNLKLPVFLTMPVFELEITMDWDCESGAPLNHYLHAFPRELKLREKVYDPFRSTSFSLVLNFGFKANEELVLNEDLPAAAAATATAGDQKTSRSFTTTATTTTAQAVKGPTRWISHGSASPASHEECVGTIPTMNLGAHDLMWIFKWWSLYYLPPHKLRSFARFPRFGVPRVPRSGNLSLDKVLTEFMLRVDSTPACIYHSSLMEDDPAIGLAFHMKKLKYELCYSRGLGHFTIETKRDPLELVYQGLDIHSMKVELHRDQSPPPADDNIAENLQKSDKVKQLLGLPEVNLSELVPDPFRSSERGFLLTTDRLTIRKQAPKADSARLSLWLEGSRRQLRVETAIRNMDIDYGSGSDVLSDDDGFNVVLADNCLRVSLYGLKLLWTLENRDAVWAWVGDMAQAFEHPKPSPSRQFAQRKRMEEQQKVMAVANKGEKGKLNGGGYSSQLHKGGSISAPSSPSRPSKLHTSTPGRDGANSLHSASTALPKEALSEEEGEGTMHFMVNVVQPQFNLHSEEAHGRLLLAAASGQVLACSYHSLVSVGFDMIVQALGSVSTQGALQEIAWKRRELSVLLKHVQAHIAPTDVDPGAGLQWLPRILTGTAKVKRTGTLLERIFMPCTMYFQYTRHKGGTTNFEVKPLKELSFNSPNITATMTSRQFQIVVDVMSNLLLARLPKSRKNKLYEEEGEEEVDEVVPEGVEEVELARIKVEQAQRECRLLFRDLRMLRCSDCGTRDVGTVWSPKAEEETLWMISSARSILAQKLEAEFMVKSKARKAARLGLRVALQHAAQQQLALKEKNKSPSSAMRISWAFDKLVWSMICDGESFAEAEINNMILMVDRDFKDIGVARFTIKSFVVKNCLPGAKLDTVLSAWNPPTEWGRNTMLRVEARQGAPKDGFSPMERFQVDIYPLRIFLTEAMYTKLWKYFFPDEEQDVKRQEVWKGSTVAKRGGRRGTSTVLVEQRSSLEASVITSSRTNIITSGLAVPPHVLPGVPVEVLPRVDFMMAAQALEVAKLQQQQRKTGTTASMNEQCKSSSSLERVEEPDIDLVSEEALTKTFRQGVSVRTSLPITSRQDALPTASGAVSTVSTSTENGGSLKSKDRKVSKSSKASLQEEKKDSKMKKSFLEFHNIKICQVELLVTYEGSPIAVSDLRLLMDTLVLLQFTGSWRRLFSKVKKHIIWSVLKSVTGMQGKKFKDKLHPESDSNSSDSGGSYGVAVEQFPTAHQRQSDRAGEGFVSSIRGLFNSQRRKARALVLRTMRGQEALDDLQISSSEDEAGISKSPCGAKRIPRRTRKTRPAHRDRGSLADRGLRGTQEASQSQSETELSEGSSMYEDFD